MDQVVTELLFSLSTEIKEFFFLMYAEQVPVYAEKAGVLILVEKESKLVFLCVILLVLQFFGFFSFTKQQKIRDTHVAQLQSILGKRCSSHSGE